MLMSSSLGDCGQVVNDDGDREQKAFFAQEELEELIEVETLYATYAHDPKTGAESPRAIIEDGDLLIISITDSGRDRRDPVLITAPAGRGRSMVTTESGYGRCTVDR